MWYQWRMKLLADLRDDLLKIDEGLEDDEKRLTQQENILDLTLPGLVEEHDKLEAERQLLQSQADEIANCDQGELQEARNNLEIAENERYLKSCRMNCAARKTVSKLPSSVSSNAWQKSKKPRKSERIIEDGVPQKSPPFKVGRLLRSSENIQF